MDAKGNFILPLVVEYAFFEKKRKVVDHYFSTFEESDDLF